MCKQIENTSKANQRIARNAAEYAYNNRRWTYGDIYDAYDRPSREKVRAWEYCKRICEELRGFDLLISSKNTFNFSAVFKFADDKTGELCYCYITKDYDRFCYAS